MIEVTNDILTLRKVRPSDLEAVKEFRAEFLRNNEHMDGTSGLARYEDPNDWYQWICNAEHKETCSPKWVPDTQFISIRNSDGKLVGMLDIRHERNDKIANYYGDIGYSIRASERKKGYAKMQLALALDICKAMGKERILITCVKDNIASAKTIQHCGGILENEVIDPDDNAILQRYWITL